MLKTILIRYPKPYLIKFIYDPLIISQLDLFDSKIEFPATLRMLAPDFGDKNSSPTSTNQTNESFRNRFRFKWKQPCEQRFWLFEVVCCRYSIVYKIVTLNFLKITG